MYNILSRGCSFSGYKFAAKVVLTQDMAFCLLDIQLSHVMTVLKHHGNLLVLTISCYKRTIMKQVTKLRNSSTGNKYRYNSFISFILSVVNKLISFAPCLNPLPKWLVVDYKKPVSVEWLLKQEMHFSPISIFWLLN